MNGPGLTPLRTLITTLITKLPFLVTQNSSSSTSMRPNHEFSENFVLEQDSKNPVNPPFNVGWSFTLSQYLLFKRPLRL